MTREREQARDAGTRQPAEPGEFDVRRYCGANSAMRGFAAMPVRKMPEVV